MRADWLADLPDLAAWGEHSACEGLRQRTLNARVAAQHSKEAALPDNRRLGVLREGLKTALGADVLTTLPENLPARRGKVVVVGAGFAGPR